MSSLRSLAYLFVASKTIAGYGLVARLSTPLIIFLGLIIPYLQPAWHSPLQLILSLAYELTLLGHIRGYRSVLNGLVLVLAFALLGLAIQLLARILGFAPLDPATVVAGTARLVALLLAISLLFQMLTISELRYILEKMGFKSAGEILALAFAQVPVLLLVFSEALTTIRLKLGRQNPVAVVKPLVVEAVLTSSNLAEALYIHGIPSPLKPVAYKGPRDITLVLGAIAASIAPLLL